MRALTLALAVLAPQIAAAQTGIEVDMELVLAVDVSRSMSPAELEIQRIGYAEALRSPAVMGAVQGGFLGRIAVTYVEWAGEGSQNVVADWTILAAPEDAAALAARILATRTPTMRRTSISGAIRFGLARFGESPFTSYRRVIDVSGDGPNNQGEPAPDARDAAVAEGVTINGLPLMTDDGMGAGWHLEDLDAYYTHCVIGGPGAFVVPVTDWAEFAEAVRRKLVMEISGLAPPPVVRVQYAPAESYDCMIGERIWERNRRGWEWP